MSLILALLLGALSATGFAPLNLWPVTIIALVIVMIQLRRADKIRQALLIGWLFGVGHFTIGLNWITTAFTFQDAMPHWLGWLAVVLLSLYLAVFPAATFGLAWRYGRKHPMLSFILIFAAAWIVTEWLRATVFTGFAWNPLGVIWIGQLPIARASQWIGTYGLSALVIFAAGGVLLVLQKKWLQAGFMAAALLLIFGVGLRPSNNHLATGVQLQVVQPNIGQDTKYDERAAAQHFAQLARLSGATRPAPRLILWPEAATLDYLEEEGWARRRLAALLGPRDLLLTGGDALVYDKNGNLAAAHNSLFVVGPDAGLHGRYDKSHLVPYGEYLPMRPLLSAIGLSRLVPGDFDFLPGPGPQTLHLSGFGAVGIQICYEIIFSGHVIDEKDRPNFLFNPSNDAWFGRWGPPQHLAQARLRAIEEGLPVVRATPTGISAVVDADGRLIAALPWRKAGVIQTQLPPPNAPTLFSRFGNALPFALASLLVAAALLCRLRNDEL